MITEIETIKLNKREILEAFYAKITFSFNSDGVNDYDYNFNVRFQNGFILVSLYFGNAEELSKKLPKTFYGYEVVVQNCKVPEAFVSMIEVISQ